MRTYKLGFECEPLTQAFTEEARNAVHGPMCKSGIAFSLGSTIEETMVENHGRSLCSSSMSKVSQQECMSSWLALKPMPFIKITQLITLIKITQLSYTTI
jgi:hypothetical protein